jgi:hypothetical protein
MLPCTTAAFTSTDKPDDLSSLRDDLLNRYASSRSRYRGRGSHGVVPAHRAVSAFYAVFVHRLAGLPSLRSRHASWASPASVAATAASRILLAFLPTVGRPSAVGFW